MNNYKSEFITRILDIISNKPSDTDIDFYISLIDNNKILSTENNLLNT